MILLTKLNGTSFALNSDLIETIEEKPDTTIQLTNKSLYIVRESMEEVVDLIVRFRRAYSGVIRQLSNTDSKGREEI